MAYLIQTLVSAVVVYVSTSIDDLFILMVLFGQPHSRKGALSIWRGQYAGVGILIAISLLAAFALHLVPQSWIVGFLGLAPIALGIRAIRKNPEEPDTEVLEKMKGINADGSHRLFWTMTVITIAAGGDNLGIYIPYFVSLDYRGIFIAIMVFLVLIALFCRIGQWLAKIPFVAKTLSSYSRIIIPIVFITLGILILLENGTLQKLLSFSSRNLIKTL
jgi:cadmium resistance transport/sequestration family protein